MTPLEIFRDIWATYLPGTPLVEVVNAPVGTDELPDIWAGVVDTPRERVDATMGSRPWVVLSGAFMVGLFTRSGGGPDALDATVQAVRDTYQGAARDGLLVLRVDGPLDVDPEADGEWWRLALTVEYEFQSRRTAGVQPPAPLDGWERMSP